MQEDTMQGPPPTATVTQCVILAGTATGLAGLIRGMMRFGVTDVLVLTDSPAVAAALPAVRAALPRPIGITVSEAATDGAGALRHARGVLNERFLLCGGGCVLDFNLARLLADSAARPGPRIVRYAPHGPGPGLALLDPRILPLLPMVADVLPALDAAGALHETVVARTPATHRPALMLDRDGTINRDHGWVGTPDRWEWIDGAVDAICAATEAGWHVFVVTNQSGIARGYYDEAALGALHGWMTEEIRRAGGTVDDIRFCPFHAEAGIGRYRQASDWRKPAPGMILDLIARWRLDPARCVMVGDQPSDMAAAAAAGIRGQHFAGGNLLETVQPLLDRK